FERREEVGPDAGPPRERFEIEPALDPEARDVRTDGAAELSPFGAVGTAERVAPLGADLVDERVVERSRLETIRCHGREGSNLPAALQAERGFARAQPRRRRSSSTGTRATISSTV